jgi:hypothetical protein
MERQRGDEGGAEPRPRRGEQDEGLREQPVSEPLHGEQDEGTVEDPAGDSSGDPAGDRA